MDIVSVPIPAATGRTTVLFFLSNATIGALIAQTHVDNLDSRRIRSEDNPVSPNLDTECRTRTREFFGPQSLPTHLVLQAGQDIEYLCSMLWWDLTKKLLEMLHALRARSYIAVL